MTTSLTLYGTTNSSTVVTGTATELISTGASGAQGTTIATTVGASTGWFEIYTNQTNSTGSAGSQGAPTGHGQVFDATTLDGKSIISGGWTPTQTFKTSVSGQTATCDIVYRIYKYNGGTYTLLGGFTHSNQTITNTSTQFTPSAQTLGQMDFVSGDHLYLDIWINITSTTCTSGTAIDWRPSSSTTSGWTGSQLVTPGYATTGTKDGLTRFKVAGLKNKDGVTRLRLSGSVKKNGEIRFRLSANQKKDGEVRFKTNAAQKKDGSTRFILKSANSVLKNGVTRFVMHSGTINRDGEVRFRQSITNTHDFKIRFIQLSGRKLNGVSRFRQVSGTINRDGKTRFSIRNVTALTLYMIHGSTTVLSNAATLTTSSSNTINTITRTSTIGTSIGFGELFARGTTQTWQGSSTAPSPSGNGWLYDSTALEGNSFLPGPWSDAFKLNTSAGSITADIHMRAFRYTPSTNTYAQIVDQVQSAQNITTSKVLYQPSATTTTASLLFATGDKLYIDILLNITQNKTNSGNANAVVSYADSTTTGEVQAEIITSGYAPPVAANKDGVTRFRINVSRVKDVRVRFKLSGSKNKDGLIRFKALEAQFKNAALRFVQRGSVKKDASVRLRANIFSRQDGYTRFVQRGFVDKNATARFKQATALQYRNGLARFLTNAAKTKDAFARFRQNSALQKHDGLSRFRLHIVTNKDGQTRFVLHSGTITKDFATRFLTRKSVLKDAETRFRQRANQSQNAETRFRQSITTSRNGASRFLTRKQVLRDASTRFRFRSVTIYRDAASRFRQYVPVKKDGSVRLVFLGFNPKNAKIRFVQRGVPQRDCSSRFKLSGLILKDAKTRFRFSAVKIRDASTRLKTNVHIYADGLSRFRQYVPVKRDAETRLKTRVQKFLDAAQRFRLQSVVQKHDGASRFKAAGFDPRSCETRFRLSAVQKKDALIRFKHSDAVKRDASVRFQTFAYNPKDGKVRFVLKPSTVGISAAETEVVFPDGIFEATFAG